MVRADLSALGPAVQFQERFPFSSERSRRAYRLNQCLGSLRKQIHRAQFQANPEAYMSRHALSEPECDMLRRRDYRALLDHGACLLTLANVLALSGQSLVEFGAQGRGQTVAEFMAHKRAEAKGQPWQF